MAQPLQFTIFYGYPAELVAEWCCVSLRAARDLKTGKRKPTKQVAKLFLLHKAERVLTGKWRDWVVRGDTIVDPDGKATTHAQLQGYWLIMQFAAELAREAGPSAHLEFHRLLA
jgi:hypothetical protein